MVAYLSKSDASEGSDQIIDFLNGSYIAYALTVNQTICVSCIKQFWRTIAVKSSNDVTRLQALVDKKKVVVTEAAIRDAFHLDDAEGVDCLPNEEIFTELARMGYEKPSTKLTFYKAFFSSQWKFLIHIILQSMSAKRTSWNEFSSAMASTIICLSTGRKFNFSKYIFGDEEEQGNANIVAKELETAIPEDAAEDQPIPSPTPLTPPPQQLQDEALDACAALSRRVEHLEQDKVAQDLEIIKLITSVKKLEKTNKAKTLKLRRLRKVGTSQRVDTFNDTLMEDVSNHERVIDRDEDAVKKADKVPETISAAAAVPTVIVAPVKVADIVKVAALVKAVIDEETKRAIKSINQTPAQKAVKRRKLIDEAKEAKSIKQHLQIVPDEDDDVFTKDTLLARKVPVVDYHVIFVNNKPQYKIIKANDTHQLYASFITLLKNFNREDLETLWRTVKESRQLTFNKPHGCPRRVEPNKLDDVGVSLVKIVFEKL
nr:hypothetical protein [Tanacetum cinerariifolium]